MFLGEDTGGVDVADSGAPEVEYHEPTESYRAEFDRHTHLATEAVITAVATATDTAPHEIPPLAHTIDPDALNQFFTANPNRNVSDTTITFEYAGHTVTVNGHGTVIVNQTEQTHP